MEICLGMGVDGNIVEWVLKLNKSLYGNKQASANWFDLLKNGLESRGYHEYQIYTCIFYRKWSGILTYVDDFIIVSRKQETTTSLIYSRNNGTENLCRQMKDPS